MASGLLVRVSRVRVGKRPLLFLPYALWSLTVASLLLTFLPLVHPGVAVWQLPAEEVIPFYVVGATSISYALLLFLACAGDRGVNLYMAVASGILCYGMGACVLLLLPELAFSRGILGSSVGLAILLGLYPLVLPRFIFMFSLPLLLLLVVAVNGWFLQRPVIESPAEPERIISARYVINKETQQVVPQQPEAEGGALTPYGEGFIAATANGLFYRLDWTGQGNELHADALKLSSPLAGRDTFYEKKPAGLQFRITDILVEYGDGDGSDALLVSHQVWDREDDCFRMAVSRARLDPQEPGSAADWERLYTTQPCIEQPFDTVETGGRLAWVDGGLMFTLGDHGKDGRGGPAYPQIPSSDYGKVLLLDMQGGAEVFTLGHRNPQGLLVDSADRIWVTEHGPAGGDELNLLREGGNYGWPLATYGADYNKRTWPLNPDSLDHGGFTEPVYAFVPSVAISNLIQVGAKQFPRWKGDFLIGSLRKESLYRAHVREERVIYVEPLTVGKRIRDLVEAEDGRVLLWSDDETVTVLSRRPDANTGEDIFDQCRVCHERMGRDEAPAPNLSGIVGRKIAAKRNFNYSPALRAVKGRWTEARLLEFLQNPQQFAPGTSMGANGVSDAAERAALVQFLKTYGKKP
ncbi:PQQ-dependent sugar dehydrogenase [Candidatus Marimicrobium litorale]|uniref:C-type cytochrome n=1 Tax=Candidatus Marimicrobium litorale TaxID=2518991 RepID=A0ABT3T6W0_9GAMM|nr:PQQ-dependent sugar dehydrogenase [Candidatus Marimicrobium litorale]MCX2978008.1 c-type cytochrome [Candidatus Marimicrobium litorale]